ncbi:hypothetical protein QF032_000099 [Streptomyces achromogenes]|nr:hypothetical protein [Streptomyces achromogenes]
MAHETAPRPPVRPPRPDLSLAQDCKDCHEWGTVVTSAGHHTLCPACQHPAGEGIDPQLPEETIDRASPHP